MSRGSPLVVPDAVSNHRHQYAPDLRPGQTGKDHDPDGEFVRRLVAEHVGLRIGDHAAAYKSARERMVVFRRQPEI